MSFIKKLLSLLSIRKYSKLILLGGIVFIIGFIWHFPFNLLKDFIRSKIQQNTRVIIDVQDIKPSLPLGFTFIDPRVSNIQITGKNLDFDLELLKISTTPWSLITFGLSQSGTIHYKAKKKTFSAKGHIVFGKNILGFSTNTKNLQIDDAILIQEPGNPYTQEGLRIPVIATIAGDIEFDINRAGLEKQDVTSLEGDAKLMITNAKVEAPIVGTFEFSKIVADVRSSKGVIELKSVNFSGKQISGKGSGTIKINSYFPESALNLDATVTFSDDAEQLKSLIQTVGGGFGLRIDASGKMPLRIKGTVAAPVPKGY